MVWRAFLRKVQRDLRHYHVPTSIVGYLMYIFSILAVVLIVINLLGITWALTDYTIPLIFAAIIAGFVCSFIEIGRGTKLAYERIRKRG